MLCPYIYVHQQFG
nr:unnamed protein product [Callosobruchus analis]